MSFLIVWNEVNGIGCTLTPALVEYIPTYSSGCGGTGGPGCSALRMVLASRMICWAMEMILACDEQLSQLWRKMNPVLISCWKKDDDFISLLASFPILSPFQLLSTPCYLLHNDTSLCLLALMLTHLHCIVLKSSTAVLNFGPLQSVTSVAWR